MKFLCFIWYLRARFLGLQSHERIRFSRNYVIKAHFSKSMCTTPGQNFWGSLYSMSVKFLFCQRGPWESCQYVVTEKTFTGHQKMTEAQLIHLAQPTRHRELTGETIGPWCHIYMQKNWINEETSGYFRWHQNDQSGCLIAMCNLARN